MEIFAKFIYFLNNINLKFKKYKYRKYLKTSNTSGNVKSFVGKDFTVRFDSIFEDKKREVQKKVENLVRKAKNNPYRLIAYIEKHGTKILQEFNS